MSYDDGSLAFKLRQEFGVERVSYGYENLDASFLDDDFDGESVDDGRFSYGDFQLVGHGKVTNDYCGNWRAYFGCPRVDEHNIVSLDGQNFCGKVFVKHTFFSCDKPSCPKCYKFGWAVREAGKIEMRLAEASKRFGLVEHIVATVPPRFYGLDFEALRKKVVGVLFARGVLGGVLIFHGFRYNKLKRWYWSPHFHCLGFILGGYGKCRGCSKCVKGCGGFVDRSYRCFEKDGCVVRVLGKRKTVGGTAWYQLNHASLKVGVKRFHVATWFGCCSYRKLKVTVKVRKSLCPICHNDLVRMYYSGQYSFCKDRNSVDFKREFFADFDEGDGAVWVEGHSAGYG